MTIDYSKYPYLIQLYPRPMFGPHYDGRVSNIDINIDAKEITIRKVKQSAVNERIYEIEDDSILKLFEFFSIDAIENFEAIPEENLMDMWTGYRDEGYKIEYYLFFENHDPLRIEGTLTWIFKNYPMEKLLDWLRETALPGLEDARI